MIVMDVLKCYPPFGELPLWCDRNTLLGCLPLYGEGGGIFPQQLRGGSPAGCVGNAPARRIPHPPSGGRCPFGAGAGKRLRRFSPAPFGVGTDKLFGRATRTVLFISASRQTGPYYYPYRVSGYRILYKARRDPGPGTRDPGQCNKMFDVV